jgi:hypothetical protein
MQAVERAIAQVEAARCGAATLLQQHAWAPGEQASGAAAAGPAKAEGGVGQEPPQLFHAAALQLWLLKCCQAVSVLKRWSSLGLERAVMGVGWLCAVSSHLCQKSQAVMSQRAVRRVVASRSWQAVAVQYRSCVYCG